ncbi:InlB B-repeat-containing protein [Candidatus Methanarcanum hacksteinii]|uniref:InlB B-repeat-containing protein n=1 Tax=Candidatus Methanarcanum hacksteinii TaxID=2911857 RepID=UPI0037DD6284
MDKKMLGLALIIVTLCFGCTVFFSFDNSVADGNPGGNNIVYAGNNEFGWGYYKITDDNDQKTATFIGIHKLPGTMDNASFTIASYLTKSNNSDNYDPRYSEAGEIPVTKIRGQRSVDNDGNAPLAMNGIKFINDGGGESGSVSDFKKVKLKLTIPVTIKHIEGENTLFMNWCTLIFDERTEGEPLSFGSKVFKTKYVGYSEGMRFPNNVTFKADAFSSFPDCNIYFGTKSSFESGVAFNLDRYATYKYEDFSKNYKIFSETNLTELFKNATTVAEGVKVYQSALAGGHDDAPHYLGGYYLKDRDYLIVDYVKQIEDNLYAYVLFDKNIKDKVTNTVIQKDNSIITLTVAKKDDINLQAQYETNVLREESGVFDISGLSKSTIIQVKLTDWKVTCKSDDNTVFRTVVVEDGATFDMADVPFKDGVVFNGWQSNGSDYDSSVPVRSDLTLVAKWASGHILTISPSSSIVSVSGVGDNDLNEYGAIKPNGSIKLSVSGSEKIEIRQWSVVVGNSSVVIKDPGTQGNICLSDDRRVLTISSINSNVAVNLDAIYISESHAPAPVVTVDTPSNVTDLVQKWAIGTGQTSNVQNMWAGGSSEPLILGDYAYVRMGASLFKIDTNNGNVVATAESGLTYAFFHNLGYLGNGYIVDYVTENVYDMDLKSAGFKVSGKVVFDDVNRVAYSFIPKDDVANSPAKISLYDPYAGSISGGYLSPLWTKGIDHGLYINQGGPSLPLILDGSVYWLSGEKYSDGKNKIWISVASSDTGSEINSCEIVGLKGLLLDNGWITTDGELIYVTSYGVPLLSGSSSGQGKVAVLSKDFKTVKTLFLKGTSEVTSGMVVVDNLAFVKVGAEVYVYQKDTITNAANDETPEALKSIKSVKSHGSIVVNKCGTANEYYIYYATYDDGKIHIIKYESETNVFTDSVMDDLHTYCSQGIRVSQSGNLIYYDDTGKLYGYVSVKNNTYLYVIDDGSNKILVESKGADPASALSSSGYGFVSNGILSGVKTSADGAFDSDYSLYVLDYGVWKPIDNKDLLSQKHGNVWLITKSKDSLPNNNTSLSLVGTDDAVTLDYVAGNKVDVNFGNVKIEAPYASYSGMVVRIYTDTTEVLTITSNPDNLIIKSHGPNDVSYSFVMPNQDVILTGNQPIKYTVTFVNDDGTVLKTTQYVAGTSASSIVMPENPTKEADTQYTYTFSGWDPEIADVTGNVTYKATYTKSPISSGGVKYTLTGTESISGANMVIDLDITRSSGDINISNARLLVIAMYEGGISVNVYSKVDLASNGSASEQVVVSKDRLLTVTVKMLDGVPVSGQPFDNFGSYEYKKSGS